MGFIRNRWVLQWFSAIPLHTRSPGARPETSSKISWCATRAHLSMVCPSIFEVAETIESMPNRRVFGPDELPADLLKPIADEDRNGNRCALGQLCTIMVLHKKKDRTRSAATIEASRSWHMLALQQVLLRGENCGRAEILPEQKCGSRPQRVDGVDMISVVRRLDLLGRKKSTPRYMCFVEPINAYDSAAIGLSCYGPCSLGSAYCCATKNCSRLFATSSVGT